MCYRIMEIVQEDIGIGIFPDGSDVRQVLPSWRRHGEHWCTGDSAMGWVRLMVEEAEPEEKAEEVEKVEERYSDTQ